ncbi:MAG: hypothetical protein K0Q99_971 [Clostridia bacterium]|jgi:uncharacterized protein (DUF2249 family)|nr:hypothetical protein [Clostridia bacterium]
MSGMRRIDIRELDPIVRYPTVASTFEDLTGGEKLELINDHDLKHLLKYKFTLDYPDEYDYEYIEQGPLIWQVVIIKRF